MLWTLLQERWGVGRKPSKETHSVGGRVGEPAGAPEASAEGPRALQAGVAGRGGRSRGGDVETGSGGGGDAKTVVKVE